MQSASIVERLRSLSTPEAVAGMARFGITGKNALGISIYRLREIAREIGTSHELAQELWATGIHEARILASMIDDSDLVTDEQMESWVVEFDSWDICDQCCSNLLDRTEFAYKKAFDWSERPEEFVKRAGFALMACLAVHDKTADDAKLAAFFPVIARESTDDRNYVKKAVNWALRQIGKRNQNLNRLAIQRAQEIRELDSRAARWIAADALRELTSERVQHRLEGPSKVKVCE